MIIGIDASRANRSRRTGTEWYSFYLIKELAKIDSENQYVLYTDRPLRADLANLLDDGVDYGDDFNPKGEQIIRSPHGNITTKLLNWPFSFFWTQGRLSLEMIFHAPDVLFVPGHVLPIFHPKKSVVTVHDIGFERDRGIYRNEGMGPDSQLLKRAMNYLVRFMTKGKFGANTLDYLSWSTQYALKHAHRVITVSEFSKSEIISVYSKTMSEKLFTKLRVVLNGYNDKLFCKTVKSEAKNKVIEKYGIKEPFLFYLGRIERKKNIPSLVEAFGIAKNKLPGMNLVLTGNASFGADEVRYLINEYGIEDKVKLTGWVEEEDLPYIFDSATAFVFPSTYEGFGIPLVEAMACGVPIACSTAPAITEVVAGAALTFKAIDKNDIARCLVEISTNEDLRNKLREKGYDRAKNFNWTKSAHNTLAVLLEK